jgi:hypothetical protein
VVGGESRVGDIEQPGIDEGGEAFTHVTEAQLRGTRRTYVTRDGLRGLTPLFWSNVAPHELDLDTRIDYERGGGYVGVGAVVAR